MLLGVVVVGSGVGVFRYFLVFVGFGLEVDFRSFILLGKGLGGIFRYV